MVCFNTPMLPIFLDSQSNNIPAGLRNNTEPETFPLLYTHQNLIFPVRYIKIVPLSTFAPNFNFSIWHVCLKGIQDSPPMQRVMAEYQNVRSDTDCFDSIFILF